jgi:quercetin dioxygenase-like cupin family protein
VRIPAQAAPGVTLVTARALQFSDTGSVNYTLISNLSDEVKIPENGILSRTLYNDDHVKVLAFGFAAGQELSAHTAPMCASIYIHSGEARLTLGADAHEAQAGAFVHMPPNMPHSLYAKTPVVMLLQMYKQAREGK